MLPSLPRSYPLCALCIPTKYSHRGSTIWKQYRLRQLAGRLAATWTLHADLGFHFFVGGSRSHASYSENSCSPLLLTLNLRCVHFLCPLKFLSGSSAIDRIYRHGVKISFVRLAMQQLRNFLVQDVEDPRARRCGPLNGHGRNFDSFLHSR